MRGQVVRLFAVSSIGILAGCVATSKPIYHVSLTEVERPADATQRYGEPMISRADSAGVARYQFADSLVVVNWAVGGDGIAFNLRNMTDHSLKIIWDEAAYVDHAGASHRIMHAGVKYIDRNNPQPPTVVVRHGYITDMVEPTDYVYYTSGKYGGWGEVPLLEPSSVGQTVQVLLPIEIEGVINEYLFKFKVEDMQMGQ